MKFKKLLVFGLPILAVAGLATSLSVSLVSCSKEQLQSIFDKIQNAISAIGSLGGQNVGSGDKVETNTVNIDKIREVLANAFGVKIDEFTKGIQTLNLVPIKNENTNKASSWIVTILLKEDSNYVWPQELIDSQQNSAKENHQDAFYFATDKFLSFKVSANFQKIVINAYNLKNNVDIIKRSINALNGADIYTQQNSNNNQWSDMNETDKANLVYAISQTSDTFIPSSISMKNSVVQYQMITTTKPQQFLVTYTKESIPSTPINETTISQNSYNNKLSLKPGEGYVFINEKNEIMDEVSFDNIEYQNHVDIDLGNQEKDAIFESIVSANKITDFDKEGINLALSDIKKSLDASEKFTKLKSYLKSVEYKLRTPSTEIKPVNSKENNQQELVFRIVFEQEVNFKSFASYKPQDTTEEQGFNFTLQTNIFEHNIIETSGIMVDLK